MKVILSHHLPGIIDIWIPIALPFNNIVEMAGELETTKKYIKERNWLASGYYLNLSEVLVYSEEDKRSFFRNNKLPVVACKKIGIKELSDLLVRNRIDISTIDFLKQRECFPGKKYYIGEYNLRNADITKELRISRDGERSISEQLIINIMIEVIDKHGMDKFFL